MEGRVYIIAHRRKRATWEFWLRDRPAVRSTAESPSVAIEQLTSRVFDLTGDGEPVFTYDPPLPGLPHDRQFLDHGFMAFRGSGYTDLATTRLAEMFTEERCRKCSFPGGVRSSQRIELESAMDEHVGMPSGSWWFFCLPILVSGKFMELLSVRERACAEWRECKPLPRSRKRVFEVLPKVLLPTVLHRRMMTGGWRCSVCGHQCASVEDQRTDIQVFIRRASISKKMPALFGVGDATRYYLVMRRGRVLELLKDKQTRGMQIEPLGALDDADVDESPRLRDYPNC